MLEFLIALVGLILFYVVLWFIGELFFRFYWGFVCYGIENGYIKEDIFGKIEEMKKVIMFGGFWYEFVWNYKVFS